MQLPDSNPINIDDILKVVKSANLPFSDNYKISYIINLLSEKTFSKFSFDKLAKTNVFKTYKSTLFHLNNIVCDAIYHADTKFLKICLNLLADKQFTKFKFEPFSRKSHQEVLKWILLNLDKIRDGQSIGWKAGPDSGPWPSSNPEDYIKTYELIQPLIHYNIL